jgi:hypothetical protein
MKIKQGIGQTSLHNYILFCFLSLVSVLTGCTKEEITSREFPRVKSIGVTEVTVDGALFTGELFYIAPNTTDYGFVWSDSGFPTLDKDQAIPFRVPDQTKVFESVAQIKMVKGKTYTMRTFAVGNGYVVYGDAIDFVLK